MNFQKEFGLGEREQIIKRPAWYEDCRRGEAQSDYGNEKTTQCECFLVLPVTIIKATMNISWQKMTGFIHQVKSYYGKIIRNEKGGKIAFLTSSHSN